MVITDPCPCEENLLNDITLCYSAVGESIDEMYSKQKALSDARVGIASLVQTHVQALSTKYTDSKNSNQTEQLDEKRQDANRQVINQTLRNIKVACQQTRKTKSGNYKTYIRLEINRSEIEKSFKELATNQPLMKNT